MSKLLSVVLAAGLLVYPFATSATDYGSQTSLNQQAPPVAQPLVREGDFAIKLATQLNLGSPSDEATAEDMLANAGVAPANGWISDYPVTPEIIGQINDSIQRASETGRLPMGADEAKKELTKLAGQMDLPLPAGPGYESSPGQPSLSSQNAPVINNYYYEQGPPVITYYAPPVAYAYLYDWVPYPAFWFGFSFPGFFICHDFTRVVVSPFPHHRFHRAIVSDHFIDPATRRVVHIDHVFKTDRGVIRPHSVIRSREGTTFNNLAELHGGKSFTGNRFVTPPSVRGNSPSGGMKNRMFAQKGLQRNHNFARSFNSPAPGNRSPGPMTERPSFSGTVNRGRGQNNMHPNFGSRFPQRTFSSPTPGNRAAGPPMQRPSVSPPMNTGRSVAPGPSSPHSATVGPLSGGISRGSGAGGFGGHGGRAGGRR